MPKLPLSDLLGQSPRGVIVQTSFSRSRLEEAFSAGVGFPDGIDEFTYEVAFEQICGFLDRQPVGPVVMPLVNITAWSPALDPAEFWAPPCEACPDETSAAPAATCAPENTPTPVQAVMAPVLLLLPFVLLWNTYWRIPAQQKRSTAAGKKCAACGCRCGSRTLAQKVTAGSTKATGTQARD